MNETTTKQRPVKFLAGTKQENDTIFLCGVTGSGKTVLMSNLLHESNRDFVIVDTQAQFAEFPAVQAKSFQDLVDALNHGHRRVVVGWPSFAWGDFDRVILILDEHQRRNPQMPAICVAVDEAAFFCEGNTCCGGLDHLIARGRTVRLTKMFNTQWFNRLPPRVRDSATEIYIFHHRDKRAQEIFGEYGLTMDDLAELEPLECFHVKGACVEKLELEPQKQRQPAPMVAGRN